jgi:hypothetical protein
MGDFDATVKRLRGTVEPKPFRGRKAECKDPAAWAAHLDYQQQFSARNRRYSRKNRAEINRRQRERRAAAGAEKAAATAAYMRQYHSNPANQRRMKCQRLFRLYSLTLAQYSAAEASRGGACAICGQPCPTGRSLAVDHDHATGVYRGLLCAHHNTGIGLFADSPELLRKAADYLEAGGDPSFCIVTYARLMEEQHGN